MASGLVPRIIILALGAGALGFPDALRVLLDDVAGRGPLIDIAICAFAIAVVTAQALGAMLLARFLRKASARAGGDAHTHVPRADRFAQVTLVLSLGVAFLVSACLLVASGAGAGARGLLDLVVADVARTMKSPVVAALATAAAVLLCTGPLLRVFRREEDRSQGTGTVRFANMAQVASFTRAAAFLLASFGGLYVQRGSLVDVSVGVAAAIVAMLIARFTLTRRAHNEAGAGGRAAPAPPADTRRFGKLTKLAPYLAVVGFVALLCCLVLTTDAPLESGLDGAKYP